MPASVTPFPTTRSRYTLGEYKSRVRREVQLLASSLLREDDLADWGNEAQEIFAIETGWYKGSDLVSSVSGTAEYDLPNVLSGRAIGIREVFWDSLPLYRTTIEALSAWEGNWRGNSGRPSHYILRGGMAFRLWPVPAETTVDVMEVFYTALPPVVVDDDDTFYMPHGFDHAYIRYGVVRASLKDAHGEGARRLAIADKEWMEALDRGKRKVNETDEEGVTRLGEDVLTGGLRVGGYVPWFTEITAP